MQKPYFPPIYSRFVINLILKAIVLTSRVWQSKICAKEAFHFHDICKPNGNLTGGVFGVQGQVAFMTTEKLAM